MLHDLSYKNSNFYVNTFVGIAMELDWPFVAKATNRNLRSSLGMEPARKQGLRFLSERLCRSIRCISEKKVIDLGISKTFDRQ